MLTRSKLTIDDGSVDLARSSLVIDEGSLGEKRTKRKVALAWRRVGGGFTIHRDDPDAAEKYQKADDHIRKIEGFKVKGERGGRWGTDNTSPAARKAERDLAADEIERHAEKVRYPKSVRQHQYPDHPNYFYKRMQKHRETQGTGRQGDVSGVGHDSRLPRDVRRPIEIAKKAAARKDGAPKIHPSVQAAMTKARIKKDRGDRAQEREWAGQDERAEQMKKTDPSAHAWMK